MCRPPCEMRLFASINSDENVHQHITFQAHNGVVKCLRKNTPAPSVPASYADLLYLVPASELVPASKKKVCDLAVAIVLF